MHEPITVNVDRGRGDGARRSNPVTFIGRLLETVQRGHTTVRLYEWADRGRLAYLVHVEEHRPGRPPRRTLYPFVNTHSAGAAPTKGYTAEEVSRAYPEFADGGSGGRRAARGPSGPSPYSLECVEGQFSELRAQGFQELRLRGRAAVLAAERMGV
jgi:hypothetical protein